MKRLKFDTFFPLLKATYNKWNSDKAPRLGAALSYYTVFSLAPLLLIFMAVAGAIFGREAAEGQIREQIRGVVGNVAARAIQGLILSAHHPGSGVFASVIAIVTAIAGAAGFFGQLQDALNTIWGVQLKPGLGWKAVLRQRVLSFAMVVGTGFLLLVSLFVSAGLSAANHYMDTVLPLPGWTLQLFNNLVSFAVITLLFAMIYRGLPDVEIGWRDVWVGAAITSLLFAVGKWGLGIYISHSAGSALTAAGSLLALFIWVYYAAQILLFGAEFTYVYADKFGSEITPSKNAILISPEKPIAQLASAAPAPVHTASHTPLAHSGKQRRDFDIKSFGAILLSMCGAMLLASRFKSRH